VLDGTSPESGGVASPFNNSSIVHGTGVILSSVVAGSPAIGSVGLRIWSFNISSIFAVFTSVSVSMIIVSLTTAGALA